MNGRGGGSSHPAKFSQVDFMWGPDFAPSRWRQNPALSHDFGSDPFDRRSTRRGNRGGVGIHERRDEEGFALTPDALLGGPCGNS